ncbi:MAG TPA: PfkB family carbohydrate kinase [Micromonosporaceae bacterium]|nr:PfkB family carbohydrate kinase [Micromonosporaceae bacterium]
MAQCNNADADGLNPYHETFAYQADIVFLSMTALPDHETTMQQIIARGSAQVVVATAGADGCYLLTRGESDVRHLPAAPLHTPAVDSNGAGDAFIAGFLYGHLTGKPVEACCHLGAVAGAHACTVPSTQVDPISRARLTCRTDAWPGHAPGGFAGILHCGE